MRCLTIIKVVKRDHTLAMTKTARTHLVRAAPAQRAAAADRAVNLTRLNPQITVVVHNFEKNQVKEEACASSA